MRLIFKQLRSNLMLEKNPAHYSAVIYLQVTVPQTDRHNKELAICLPI